MDQRIKGLGFVALWLGMSVAAPAQHVFKTDGLEMGIGPRGEIVRLAGPKGPRNYAPPSPPGFLVRVKNTDGVELVPAGLRVRTDLMTFAFEGGIELTVRAAQKPGYLRFELVKVVRPDKIDAVLWLSLIHI